MGAREELAAIRERAEAATEGPWVDGMGTHGNPADGPEFCEVRTTPTDDHTRGITIAELDLVQAAAQDAEFIAHARADVPRLVDALEAVLETADEWAASPAVGASSEEQWELDTLRNAARSIYEDLAALTTDTKGDAR